MLMSEPARGLVNSVHYRRPADYLEPNGVTF